MTISFVKNIPVKFDQVDEDFIVELRAQWRCG